MKDAGMFSVQMNSTQDISAHDQCAIALWYVGGDRANERPVRLLNVDNSSGKCLQTLLRNSLAEIGPTLELEQIHLMEQLIWAVFTRLQELMKAARPSRIHTWCYAHVRNLVISDASSMCRSS